MGKMKSIWTDRMESFEDSLDDYLFYTHIEEEKKRKADKRKKYITAYYKTKKRSKSE